MSDRRNRRERHRRHKARTKQRSGQLVDMLAGFVRLHPALPVCLGQPVVRRMLPDMCYGPPPK